MTSLLEIYDASRREIELSHGTTTYLERGEGPAVVLLHGSGLMTGAHSWLRNLVGLSGSFRVLAPNFVGWGAGPRLRQPYSFAYLTDFVREFLDTLGLESAHIVGHSMGGWIASLLAYESPDRVGRLVLAAPGGLALRPPHSVAHVVVPSFEEFAAKLATDLGVTTEESAALAKRVWDEGAAAQAESFERIMAHMADPETRSRYNVRRRLPRVRARTLVVWGDQDQVNDVAMAQTFVDLLPHATVKIFPGAGHGVPRERHGEFNELVSVFLRSSA